MISALSEKIAWVLSIAFALAIIGCGEDAGDVDELKDLGLASLESNDFNSAINYFKKALEEQPSDRDLLYYAGLSFKRLDMFDSALVYFRRAKILYVRDREINKEISELSPIFGDYQSALNAIAVLIATGDNEKMYWRALAELYYRTKDMYMAAKYYKLMIAEDSSRMNYYIYLSGALSQLGKFDESNEVLLTSIEKFSPTVESFANIAINYISLQMPDKAEEYFRKALSLDPDNIPVWINLAHVLSDGKNRRKKEEALEIYKEYFDRTPKVYNLDSIITALEAELSLK